MHDTVAVIGTLLAAGLVADVVAGVTRLPTVLPAIAVGTLIGPAVLGVVDVGLRSQGARLLLSVGVSFILFEGGLGLSLPVLRRVAVGLIALAVPGVVLSAAVVGGVAALVFGVPVMAGFLIGAALAPTDPAVLIPVFRRLRVRPKVAETVIAESALNDPTGAVLALTIAGAVTGGSPSVMGAAGDFLRACAVSTLVGVGLGFGLRMLVTSNRTGIWREAAPIAVVAVLMLGYPATDSLGGSGYLGAFIAGVIVGNVERWPMALAHEAELRVVASTLARVATMLVFVLLGANLPWSLVADVWPHALAVVATLVLVARPLVVAVCLGADRRGAWEPREMAFVAWCRETGVLAIAIAGILTANGVEHADLVMATVALAVLVTIGAQATTKGWAAERLGLVGDGELAPPEGREAAATAPVA